ncbi:MAG: hypothetical protein ACYC7D_14875 [Nitrososphaerales archaeon]
MTRDPSALETSASATLASGQTVPVTIYGNESGVEIANLQIFNANNTYSVNFQISGTPSTVGFANVTIPKSAVPSGYTPTVYVDGVKALDQSFTEDQSNYYVYFTTHFSTHQILVSFASSVTTASTSQVSTSSASTQSSLYIELGAVVTIATVVIFGILAFRRKSG